MIQENAGVEQESGDEIPDHDNLVPHKRKKTETAMNYQEVEFIAVLFFFTNGSTLFADPFWWNRGSGMVSRLACSPCEFPHDPQHCGAEGWAFNRDSGLSAGVLLNSSIRTIEIFRDGRERITTFALFSVRL